jgi:hypothetical protein
MSCTVVTAFYPINSKFPSTQYLEWGKTFMKIKSPIIIFTEEHLVDTLKQLREDRPIKIISMAFEELDTWKLYKDKWIKNYEIDPERYHTPELYAIWAQKAFFVERAIKDNFFNTDYFFWCDFGAFRNPNIEQIILDTFPITTYFKDNKLLLQSIERLQSSDKHLHEDGIIGDKIYDWKKCRLVGGLWGGSILACLNWKREYQMTLDKYFEKGWFAGKDQTVMLSTYLQNTSLAHVVKSNTNNWFFLQNLLSNTNMSYMLDDTYADIGRTVSVNIMGGLGNQMFQLASAYAYSKRYNGTLRILKNKLENDGRPTYWDTVLNKFSTYLVDSISNSLIQWNETSPTEFSDIPHFTDQGIYLRGYLQSYKYFDNAIEEIKLLFKPKKDLLENINNKYRFLIENKNRVVVVHARRTDYLRSQEIINFHGPLTVEYYVKAIDIMSKEIEDPYFLLSSDDSTFWSSVIQDSPHLNSNNIYILENENEINTLALLQQFNYYIIANSTFSWWAAFLSDNPKKVISPSKWFGPTGPQKYQDIHMPNWELI